MSRGGASNTLDKGLRGRRRATIGGFGWFSRARSEPAALGRRRSRRRQQTDAATDAEQAREEVRRRLRREADVDKSAPRRRPQHGETHGEHGHAEQSEKLRAVERFAEHGAKEGPGDSRQREGDGA